MPIAQPMEPMPSVKREVAHTGDAMVTGTTREKPTMQPMTIDTGDVGNQMHVDEEVLRDGRFIVSVVLCWGPNFEKEKGPQQKQL